MSLEDRVHGGSPFRQRRQRHDREPDDDDDRNDPRDRACLGDRTGFR
jgi:hypothetical protein